MSEKSSEANDTRTIPPSTRPALHQTLISSPRHLVKGALFYLIFFFTINIPPSVFAKRLHAKKEWTYQEGLICLQHLGCFKLSTQHGSQCYFNHSNVSSAEMNSKR